MLISATVCGAVVPPRQLPANLGSRPHAPFFPMIVRRSGYEDLDNRRDLYDDVNFNEDKSYHPQNTHTHTQLHTHCTLDVQW